MVAEATSRLAVRALAGALSLVLCVTLPGCSLFKKFGKDKEPESNGAAPPKFPAGGGAGAGGANAGQVGAVSSTANLGASLHGRVMDGYSRPPTSTSIRWVSLDDKKENEHEVSVTPEGYFSIVGLKEGARYKLLARGKQGERMVAGVTYATAPNIHVFIQVKEEFINGAAPGAPTGGTQDNPADKTSGLGSKAAPGGWSAGPGAANEPDLPVAIHVPGQTRNQAGPPAQNWSPAASNEQKINTWPPTLEIPRTKTLPPLQIPNATPKATVPGVSSGVSDLLGKALVPSCVRLGDRIENFALNELNGQPWELKHRKGKLVLIDFWRTDCVPCLHALPHIKDLHAKYGHLGLEVIGIANETSGTAEEQAQRVWSTCKRYGINYRQLLSVSKTCPVRRQFAVEFLPTLFLLDDQGRIIWQTDHQVSPAEQQGLLERHIKHRLTPQGF